MAKLTNTGKQWRDHIVRMDGYTCTNTQNRFKYKPRGKRNIGKRRQDGWTNTMETQRNESSNAYSRRRRRIECVLQVRIY